METRSDVSSVRDVEREVEIAAPVAAVWKALTDAHELTRWFPMEAQVTPDVGGQITMRWVDEPALDSSIEIWVPDHHLRLVGLGGLTTLVTDIFLEGRGGSTVLRVVTSGFGSDATWDDILEGFQMGWDFELLGLKHYLERHRGQDRQIARARVPITNYEDTWNRLVRSGEWFSGDLSVGSRFSISGVSAPLTGVVCTWNPPRQFVGAVSGWNDALVRVTLFCPNQMGSITAWLSAYGVNESELHALQHAWQASLSRILEG